MATWRRGDVAEAKIRPDINGQFVVSILNVNEYEVTLKKRTMIGNVFPFTECRVLQYSECPPDGEKIDVLPEIKLGENLTTEQRFHMRTEINRYSGVFARNPKKADITPLIEHSIETGNEKPAYIKPRRIPNAWRKEVDENVEEMLENNIICPSKSPWNCPIVLVHKKGKTRFVCDYRELKKTKRDTYPLSHIKDCVEKMEGAKFWSTLDAASAYWSVKVKEEDREKTAFSIPNGK